eukprot:Lankesteria_metandrocarpae@DN5104_c0_g1_i2.p1
MLLVPGEAPSIGGPYEIKRKFLPDHFGDEGAKALGLLYAHFQKNRDSNADSKIGKLLRKRAKEIPSVANNKIKRVLHLDTRHQTKTVTFSYKAVGERNAAILALFAANLYEKRMGKIGLEAYSQPSRHVKLQSHVLCVDT